MHLREMNKIPIKLTCLKTMSHSTPISDSRFLTKGACCLLFFVFTLSVCTLLKAQNREANLGQKITVYLTQQNQYTKHDLSSLGIVNGICISGSYLLWGKNQETIEHAVSLTRSQVRKRLATYLENTPIPRDREHLVVLDLEHPIHPKNFYKLDKKLLERVIKSLKMRMEISRELLPKAKLALYGIMNADSRGMYGNEIRQRIETLIYLGKRGVFDVLDYLVPVIYMRWGEVDKNNDTWEEMVRQGIIESANVKNSEGKSIPLAPINSFFVHNPNSFHHLDPVPVDLYRRILNILSEYNEVEAVIFWIGSDHFPVKKGQASLDTRNQSRNKKVIYPLDIKKYLTDLDPVKAVDRLNLD